MLTSVPIAFAGSVIAVRREGFSPTARSALAVSSLELLLVLAIVVLILVA
jgi:hypothetical protein